jgi:hypothetical protein
LGLEPGERAGALTDGSGGQFLPIPGAGDGHGTPGADVETDNEKVAWCAFFETDSALPGDDLRIVIRGHHDTARSPAAISRARSIRSAVVVPASSIRAPNRAAPSRFAAVTVVGITTLTGAPSSLPASATAWAWFPEDGATTPGTRISGSSRLMKLYAPRILKASPGWSSSGLSQTLSPRNGA